MTIQLCCLIDLQPPLRASSSPGTPQLTHRTGTAQAYTMQGGDLGRKELSEKAKGVAKQGAEEEGVEVEVGVEWSGV